MTGALLAVAMSGGVDSSTAAALLKDRGFDLVGFTLELWRAPLGPASGAGELPKSFDDARAVAARLGIPHRIVDLKKDFERLVVRSFIEDYREGKTPSPCILCNARVKFGRLMAIAQQAGAQRLATGHYARVERDGGSGRWLLRKGRDAEKDQSYFLFGLTQEQLARTVFPLGDLKKEQVRRMALRYGLESARNRESQEICFIPDGDYAGFIERYHDRSRAAGQGGADLPAGGKIVDASGRVVGMHNGIHRYTIGQRRGLGIAHSSRLYVIGLEPDENRVVVGERAQLARRSFRARDPNWVSIAGPTGPIRASVKIRSRHRETPALITPAGEGVLDVEFDSEQPAVTPGQAAVFYRGDVLLGGAWITRDE